MDWIRQDIRYAARSLVRSPAFTFAAVGTIALGMGATTTVFSLVNAILLRPFPFHQPDRLVVVAEANRDARRVGSSYPTYLDWSEGARSIDALAAVNNQAMTVRVNGEAERYEGAVVSANMFRVLGVQPVAGRDFADGEDRPGAEKVALIGHALWRDRLGGAPDAIGRTIVVNGELRTVVGVMPEGFGFPQFAEIWIPLGLDASAARGERFLMVIGRLRDGATVAEANAEMAAVSQRLAERYPENESYVARAQEFRAAAIGGIRPVMLMLLGAVGFVLLIACANVAGLLLARSAAREREIAIRSALGGNRHRIARALLTESLAIALLGGAAGTAVALGGIRALLASIPVALPYWLNITIDARVLAFTLLTSAASAVMLGLAPAIQSARVDLQSVLKEAARGATSGPRRSRLRATFVVGEIAAASLLLVGGLLMMRSFLAMRRVEPGFARTGVVEMQLELLPADHPAEEQLTSFHDRLLQRLRTIPGVTHASVTNWFPVDGANLTSNFSIGGVGEIENEPAFNWVVGPDYFAAMEIPIVRGRAFDARDRAGAARVAIVNETLAARHFGNTDAVGRRIRIGAEGEYSTIVGVAADIRQRDMNQQQIGSDIYRPFAQSPTRTATLVLRIEGDAASVVRAARLETRAVHPNVPLYSVKTVEQVLMESTWDSRLYAGLLATFAAAALLLASVGLYGVISYTVAQRTHEIGLRMALGATRIDLSRIVMSQAIRLVAFGLGIGLASALALSTILRALLFGVGPWDPVSYAGVAALLTSVALAASWIPARTAMGVDPMTALRAQ